MLLVNPAFIIIVLIACIVVVFLASSLYKPIGKFIYKIGKDAIDIVNEVDESKENKEENN